MTSFAVNPGCDHPGKDNIGTKGEAQQAKDTHVDLCDECSEDDVEIDDGIDDMEDEVEVIQHNEDGSTEVVADGNGSEPETEVVDQLPNEKPALDEDPTDWMPQHFIDEIQGVPTLNRKGYAVMCERFGVSVTSEPVTLASETDFTHAEFKAVATTDDGKEYSGFGSANVERGGKDPDDPMLLNELAETRAMKRAAAWATGVGMTAAEEMQGGR